MKFEAGNIYELRFIGNTELRPKYICVKTTGKTVVFQKFGNPKEEIKRRIKVRENYEYVIDGNYSMAPIIRADKIVG